MKSLRVSVHDLQPRTQILSLFLTASGEQEVMGTDHH